MTAAAAPAGAAGFRYGVTAGEVTDSSAFLWTRSDRAGQVILQVSRNRGFRRGVRLFPLRARAGRDNTVQRKVGRLSAGRRYHFRFVRGRARSARGTFVTAPSRAARGTVEFAWTGDTDFQPAPGQSRPFWNGGGIFRRMRAERNDFNVHLGDTMYSDTEVNANGDAPATPPALTVRQKWAKYKQNLANRNLRTLRGSGGFYSHWDDHEFINDFSPRESTFDPSEEQPNINLNGGVLYRRGVQAFRDYAPVTYSRRAGIYRSFRWGANLEVFFLDQRSFRDAKADEGGICDNPQTGSPDVAPTAPQRNSQPVRRRLPAERPSQPVSPACLAAIRNPNRDFLGDSQYSRFTRAINRSTARFKVIMNEMPIQQYYVLPYDRWEGYEAERQRLLTFLRANVKNTIFLTTDVHATLVNDARFQTLEDGGVRNSGIFDFTVGSAATKNFGQEIDDTLNSPGAGNLARDGFFKPQPPDGVGMRCSVVDQFAYGQVRVTRNTLTVTPKGINGRRLSDCAPLHAALSAVGLSPPSGSPTAPPGAAPARRPARRSRFATGRACRGRAA